MKYGIGLCLLAISTGTAYCMNEATNAAAVINVEHIKQKLQEENSLIAAYNQASHSEKSKALEQYKQLAKNNRDTISNFIAQRPENSKIIELQRLFTNFIEEVRKYPQYPSSKRHVQDNLLLCEINKALALKSTSPTFNLRATMDGIDSIKHLNDQKQQLLQQIATIEQQRNVVLPFLKQKSEKKKEMAKQEQEKLYTLLQQRHAIAQQKKELQEQETQNGQLIKQTSDYISMLNSDTKKIDPLLDDWTEISNNNNVEYN